MFILRLFEADDPTQPIDARLLRDGAILIGRDPSADWVLNDPDCRISRQHCIITALTDSITIRCLGTNGVFDEGTAIRFSDDVEVTVKVPVTLKFGDFRLVIDHAAQTGSADNPDTLTLILTPPLGSSAEVPENYADGNDEPVRIHSTSLLDCFCEGAGLEPSAFALEDPEAIMRRAGAVYRQMVLGVGDLMSEREAVRRQYQIALTTIGSANNNPFKWAPTQRLALDLLLAESHGFMSGPAALQASFRDVKKHLIATFRGLQETLRTSVALLDPALIESETPDGGSLLTSRHAKLWAELNLRHADLARQLNGSSGGKLNEVFVRAYHDESNEPGANS